MVITLIGYRGSGKSSVARLLADKLQLEWIDSDDVVEEQAGRSIREIFAEDGEAGFRRLEQAVIRELTSRDSLVIAAGGGAILADENRQAMKSAGTVVWLQARVENLVQRIQADDSTVDRRPSLTGQSVADEVESVLRSRHDLYADAATITIHTDGMTLNEVADQIVQQLPPEGSAT